MLGLVLHGTCLMDPKCSFARSSFFGRCSSCSWSALECLLHLVFTVAWPAFRFGRIDGGARSPCRLPSATIGSWGKDCRLNNMHGKARCGQSFESFSAKVVTQIGQRSSLSFSLSLPFSLSLSFFLSFSLPLQLKWRLSCGGARAVWASFSFAPDVQSLRGLTSNEAGSSDHLTFQRKGTEVVPHPGVITLVIVRSLGFVFLFNPWDVLASARRCHSVVLLALELRILTAGIVKSRPGLAARAY